MDMLENKQPQKRRMPAAAKIALAAALAAGCVLSIAAGLPAQVYNFVSGGQAVIEPGSASITFDGEPAGPLSVEDGRLWFEADGGKIDITDKVDGNTPYIQERTDPATGEKGYVIAGGTPEDFGWVELFMTEDGTCSMVGDNFADWTVPINGEDIIWTELSEDQVYRLNDMEEGLPLETTNRPWLDAALSRINLEMDAVIVD